MISKIEILEKFLEKLHVKRKKAEESRVNAQNEANDAEGAMQTRYGSAKEENQALEQSFKAIVIQTDGEINFTKKSLQEGFAKMETIQNGSLVKLKLQKGYMLIFCFKYGGETLEINNEKIIVISMGTPLFKLLNGKSLGQKITLPNGNVAEIVLVS